MVDHDGDNDRADLADDSKPAQDHEGSQADPIAAALFLKHLELGHGHVQAPGYAAYLHLDMGRRSADQCRVYCGAVSRL
jgi:hypothetical protein